MNVANKYHIKIVTKYIVSMLLILTNANVFKIIEPWAKQLYEKLTFLTCIYVG